MFPEGDVGIKSSYEKQSSGSISSISSESVDSDVSTASDLQTPIRSGKVNYPSGAAMFNPNSIANNPSFYFNHDPRSNLNAFVNNQFCNPFQAPFGNRFIDCREAGAAMNFLVPSIPIMNANPMLNALPIQNSLISDNYRNYPDYNYCGHLDKIIMLNNQFTSRSNNILEAAAVAANQHSMMLNIEKSAERSNKLQKVESNDIKMCKKTARNEDEVFAKNIKIRYDITF